MQSHNGEGAGLGVGGASVRERVYFVIRCSTETGMLCDGYTVQYRNRRVV
jgi:hypothetical protein